MTLGAVVVSVGGGERVSEVRQKTFDNRRIPLWNSSPIHRLLLQYSTIRRGKEAKEAKPERETPREPGAKFQGLLLEGRYPGSPTQDRRAQ
jgi:hypothetical protein